MPFPSVSPYVWCCTYLLIILLNKCIIILFGVALIILFISIFFFVQTKRAEGVLKAGADKAVFRDIAAEADTLEVRDSKAIMVLVELLFDENCIKQVGENDFYLKIYFYFFVLIKFKKKKFNFFY